MYWLNFIHLSKFGQCIPSHLESCEFQLSTGTSQCFCLNKIIFGYFNPINIYSNTKKIGFFRVTFGVQTYERHPASPSTERYTGCFCGISNLGICCFCCQLSTTLYILGKHVSFLRLPCRLSLFTVQQPGCGCQ